MKNNMKQQMYSKMYLITPMVYEKIKNHLDKSDVLSLTNVNKPYFTPKIEIHGSSGSNMPPPYPPHPFMPQSLNQPPKTPEGSQQPPPQSPPSPPPHNPFDLFEDMDWGGPAWESPLPTKTEFSTQTDPISEQKPPVVSHEIQTETETWPSFSQGTQTDPSISTIHQQTQTEHFPRIEQQTQTDMPILIEQSTQTERPQYREQGTQTNPILKKIVPTVTTSTQTPGSRIKPPRIRKLKVPKKKSVVKTEESEGDVQRVENIPIPETIPVGPVVQPSINQPTTSRELVEIPSKVVSTLKRKPVKVRLTPELLREYFRRNFPGRYMPPQMPSSFPRIIPRASTTTQIPQPLAYTQAPAVQYEQIPALQYEQAQAVSFDDPRALTYNPQLEAQRNYPVANIPTTQIVPTQPTYYVETPTNEPPGERSRKRSSERQEEEIVPSSKIIKRTYLSGKRTKPRPFQPTHVLSDGNPSNPNIDLPTKDKKMWPCNVCGALLSTKYNLLRHQARERQRTEGYGELPAEPQRYEPETEFMSWGTKFPAKRTSSQANINTGNYRKRVAKDPSTPALSFREWEKK